jgi:hypothetical protein
MRFFASPNKNCGEQSREKPQFFDRRILSIHPHPVDNVAISLLLVFHFRFLPIEMDKTISMKKTFPHDIDNDS